MRRIHQLARGACILEKIAGQIFPLELERRIRVGVNEELHYSIICVIRLADGRTAEKVQKASTRFGLRLMLADFA